MSVCYFRLGCLYFAWRKGRFRAHLIISHQRREASLLADTATVLIILEWLERGVRFFNIVHGRHIVTMLLLV